MGLSIKNMPYLGFITDTWISIFQKNALKQLMVFIVVALVSACGGESKDTRTYEERLSQAQQITGVGTWVLDETLCYGRSNACNLHSLQYDPETDSVAAFYGSGLLFAANTLRGRKITGVEPVVPETQAFIQTYSPDGRFFSDSNSSVFDWVSGQPVPIQEGLRVMDLTSTGASIGLSGFTYYLNSDYGASSRNYVGTVTDPSGTEFDPNQSGSNINEWLCVVETDNEFRVLVEHRANARGANSRSTIFELKMDRTGADSYSIIANDLPSQRISNGNVCANTIYGVMYVLAGDNDMHVYTDGVLTTGTELGISDDAIEAYLGSYIDNWYGQANKLGFLVKDTFVMGKTLIGVPSNSLRVATDLRRLYVMTDRQGVKEVWSAPLIY